MADHSTLKRILKHNRKKREKKQLEASTNLNVTDEEKEKAQDTTPTSVEPIQQAPSNTDSNPDQTSRPTKKRKRRDKKKEPNRVSLGNDEEHEREAAVAASVHVDTATCQQCTKLKKDNYDLCLAKMKLQRLNPEQLQAQVQHLQKQLLHFEQQNKLEVKRNQRFEADQHKIQQLEAKMNSLQQKNEGLEGQLSSLQQESQDLKANKIQKLEANVNSLQQENDSLQQEIQDLKANKIQKLQARVNSLEQENQDLNANYLSLKSQNDVTIAGLEFVLRNAKNPSATGHLPLVALGNTSSQQSWAIENGGATTANVQPSGPLLAIENGPCTTGAGEMANVVAAAAGKEASRVEGSTQNDITEAVPLQEQASTEMDLAVEPDKESNNPLDASSSNFATADHIMQIDTATTPLETSEEGDMEYTTSAHARDGSSNQQEHLMATATSECKPLDEGDADVTTQDHHVPVAGGKNDMGESKGATTASSSLDGAMETVESETAAEKDESILTKPNYLLRLEGKDDSATDPLPALEAEKPKEALHDDSLISSQQDKEASDGASDEREQTHRAAASITAPETETKQFPAPIVQALTVLPDSTKASDDRETVSVAIGTNEKATQPTDPQSHTKQPVPLDDESLSTQSEQKKQPVALNGETDQNTANNDESVPKDPLEETKTALPPETDLVDQSSEAPQSNAEADQNANDSKESKDINADSREAEETSMTPVSIEQGEIASGQDDDETIATEMMKDTQAAPTKPPKGSSALPKVAENKESSGSAKAGEAAPSSCTFSDKNAALPTEIDITDSPNRHSSTHKERKSDSRKKDASSEFDDDLWDDGDCDDKESKSLRQSKLPWSKQKKTSKSSEEDNSPAWMSTRKPPPTKTQMSLDGFVKKKSKERAPKERRRFRLSSDLPRTSSFQSANAMRSRLSPTEQDSSDLSNQKRSRSSSEKIRGKRARHSYGHRKPRTSDRKVDNDLDWDSPNIPPVDDQKASFRISSTPVRVGSSLNTPSPDKEPEPPIQVAPTVEKRRRRCQPKPTKNPSPGRKATASTSPAAESEELPAARAPKKDMKGAPISSATCNATSTNRDRVDSTARKEDKVEGEEDQSQSHYEAPPTAEVRFDPSMNSTGGFNTQISQLTATQFDGPTSMNVGRRSGRKERDTQSLVNGESKKVGIASSKHKKTNLVGETQQQRPDPKFKDRHDKEGRETKLQQPASNDKPEKNPREPQQQSSEAAPASQPAIDTQESETQWSPPMAKKKSTFLHTPGGTQESETQWDGNPTEYSRSRSTSQQKPCQEPKKAPCAGPAKPNAITQGGEIQRNPRRFMDGAKASSKGLKKSRQSEQLDKSATVLPGTTLFVDTQDSENQWIPPIPQKKNKSRSIQYQKRRAGDTTAPAKIKQEPDISAKPVATTQPSKAVGARTPPVADTQGTETQYDPRMLIRPSKPPDFSNFYARSNKSQKLDAAPTKKPQDPLQERGWISNQKLRQFDRELDDASVKPVDKEAKGRVNRSIVDRQLPVRSRKGKENNDNHDILERDTPPSSPQFAYVQGRGGKRASNCNCRDKRDCFECRRWYEVLKQQGINDLPDDPQVKTNTTYQHSRHTKWSAAAQPETPQDYWELSFIDSQKKRREAEAAALATQLEFDDEDQEVTVTAESNWNGDDEPMVEDEHDDQGYHKAAPEADEGKAIYSDDDGNDAAEEAAVDKDETQLYEAKEMLDPSEVTVLLDMPTDTKAMGQELSSDDGGHDAAKEAAVDEDVAQHGNNQFVDWSETQV